MQVKIKKKSVEENLFFVAYGIYMVTSILTTSFYSIYFMGNTHKTIVILCVCILIGKELINNSFSLNSIIGLLFVFLVMGIVVVGVGSSIMDSLILTALFVFCARDIDFREIIRLTIIISSLCLLFIIGSSYAGIIKDYISYENGRVRHYLGFRYALFGPAFMSNIVSAEIYYEKEKISYRKILILFLSSYYLYWMTDSRLALGYNIMLLAIAILMKCTAGRIIKNKISCFLMSMSFIVVAAISFYYTANYTPFNSKMYKMNDFLGGRLYLGNRSLKLYGITAFGKNIRWLGNGLNDFGKKPFGSYLYVDNLYIQMGQHFGIVMLGLYVALCTFTLFVAWRRKEYYLMLVLTFVAMHGAIDDLYLYLYYNTFWFAISYLLLNKKESVQNIVLDSKSLDSVLIEET